MYYMTSCQWESCNKHRYSTLKYCVYHLPSSEQCIALGCAHVNTKTTDGSIVCLLHWNSFKNFYNINGMYDLFMFCEFLRVNNTVFENIYTHTS